MARLLARVETEIEHGMLRCPVRYVKLVFASDARCD